MKRQLLPLFLLAGLWVVSPASASTLAQIAALPEGGHATSDDVVILSTVDLVPDPGLRSFQIRDSTRAMTVYGTNAEIAAALTGYGVGDIFGISGYTAHRDGALVLVTGTGGGIVGGTVGGFAVTGRTSTLPILSNAVMVTPSDIAVSYESNLVCLQNVQFANAGIFAVGDYSLLGGSATVRIATDDQGLTGLAIPSGPVNITGIVIPADPTSGGYRLAPRGPDDIVSVPLPTAVWPGLIGLGLVLVRRRRR